MHLNFPYLVIIWGALIFAQGKELVYFFLFTYMLPVSNHDFNGIDAQTSISLCVLFPYYSVPEIGLEKERKWQSLM